MKKKDLAALLWKEPLVSTHSHHLPEEEHQKLTLPGLLHQSYLNWCGGKVPDNGTPEEVNAWLKAVKNRSYFIWLEKALQQIYGIEKPLNAESWQEYDAAIRRAHMDAGHHLSLLTETCGYEAIFVDTYWNPGSDHGHPELFCPAYRVDRMFYGYNRKATDHNGNNLQVFLGIDTTDLDEYLDAMKKELRRVKQSGASVLKCAQAYDRSLIFGKPDKEKAALAMCEAPTEEAIRSFQNVVIHTVCEAAAELDIPVQIHTGLGKMEDSRAIGLQPLIAAHPDTTFLLMHASYPWTADIAGLVHAYPNVWADICWLPILSTTAAKRFLQELLDVCDGDRLVWGCDTWTSEESLGAKMAFIEVLSSVLCERAADGMMKEEDILSTARAIMFENARTILAKRP